MDAKDYKKSVIEIGKKAFEDVKKRTSSEMSNNKSLMIEFARHGELYSKNEEIRLMIVGRATGCFDEEKEDCRVIECENGNQINEERLKHCFEDYNENDHLNWIHSQDVRKGNKYIDSFSFFSFSKKVYLALMRQEQDYEWFKKICYTNMFKIISTKGGNPSVKLRNAQKGKMLEIMKVEIDYYKPTHILVLDSRTTKNHCWHDEEFRECLKEYVQKVGAKISFSDRPERREHDPLLEVVKADFELK